MEKILSPTFTKKKYQCKDCIYAYDPKVGDPSQGIPPGVAFDELPESWKAQILHKLSLTLDGELKVNSEEEEDAGDERGQERLEKKEPSALSVKDLVEKQESPPYSAKKKTKGGGFFSSSKK